ncbi:coiled-coil domain-containing protein [Marinoscillum furvescens]|uniref:Uncharacterized protein n=1 Tax=Marinoscillum furvescens DSM 4134 TaxID=1122208 RepID=A0A3D9L8E0_MARFU|nr:hypothetical protein [Marinoscillum furvescens]REE01137.1 hypothetical protein C7460_104157 [Marinoscillum furvescens DSM 4134]
MANENLVIDKPQDLDPKDLVKAYKKLVQAFQDLEKVNESQAETITQLKSALDQANSDVETKDAEIKQLKEDYDTAQAIITEQNASIEKMDEENGTQTGNFFTHKGKKIEQRIPKFSVKGTTYSREDLTENREITVPGKGGKPESVGLTDYLLRIKSPILEIEE